MRFAFPTLLLCAGLTGAAPVPEKPALPSGPAPRFVLAETRGDNILITSYQQMPVTVERTVPVQQGNETVLRKELVTVYRTVPVQQMLAGAAVKVYDADGTLVPTADAIARLKEATPVLQSADGKLVDPAYRAMLNKKVLILVLELEPLNPPPPPRPNVQPPRP
jgi:hypothetical protein